MSTALPSPVMPTGGTSVFSSSRRPGICPGAVVTGASYRALGVVRSLGRAGIPVCVLKSDDHGLALTSRYVRRRWSWPSGSDQTRRDALVALAQREGLRGWALIPTDDEDAALMAREHGALARYFRVTVSPWHILRQAYDKRLTHELARRIGVPEPRTLQLSGDLDPRSVAIEFPVIVKPAYRERRSGLPPAKAWRADDHRSLAALCQWLFSLTDPDSLIVQELIPGNEQFSFAALCQEGRVLASITARRSRQFPIDFGRASTFVETTSDQYVVDDAQRLLAAMGLTGIVEVEFKRDPRTGKNMLLDVNPRVWGWQSLCARAGVDFPLLLWNLINGLPLPESTPRTNVRWVRMLTDLPAALQGLRCGELSLARYVRSLRGPLEFAVFARDDPRPALADFLLTAQLALTRRRDGVAV